MGIDPHRHEDFKRWADAVIARGTGCPTEIDLRAIGQSLRELKNFFNEVIESRRSTPTDDLIGSFMQGHDGESEGLTIAEVLNFSVLLLLAGTETTTHLVGNALRALFASSDLFERVRTNRALLPALIEETLRYDAPVQLVMRRTKVEVEIAEGHLPAGAVVLLLLGSANRDEAAFDRADEFLLDRHSSKHLAFGAGPHYHCLGAKLARMEAIAALEALLSLPNLRLADEDVRMVDSFILRGARSLEVAFD
jgi:cytochrome P450